MVVISFKLEKDFLCNFYCTIFEYNYGLLYTFFSFVCYNVLSFFFFKRFLIFSIHTSNMNCRYNYKNILGFYLSRICYEIYFDRTCFKINIWNIWYDWIFVPRDWYLFIKKKKKSDMKLKWILFVCENVYFEHSMLECNQRCQIAYKQIILICYNLYIIFEGKFIRKPSVGIKFKNLFI